MSTQSSICAAQDQLSKYEEQRDYLIATCQKIHCEFEDDVPRINRKKTTCYNTMIFAVSTDMGTFATNMQMIIDNLEYGWDVDAKISSCESYIQMEIESLRNKIEDTKDLIRELLAQQARELAEQAREREQQRQAAKLKAKA